MLLNKWLEQATSNESAESYIWLIVNARDFEGGTAAHGASPSDREGGQFPESAGSRAHKQGGLHFGNNTSCIQQPRMSGDKIEELRELNR